MTAKQEIKVMLARKGLTLKELVTLLNEKHNRNDSLQNLSNKLNRDSIRYREVEEIADVLGYEIEFKQKINI